MGNLKTPIIKPLRNQGGTFYTFASAVEDIGLNIAEKRNKVRLSHYAILDIPDTDENNTDEFKNAFNFYSCPGAMGRRFFDDDNTNESSLLTEQLINNALAQSFMSYALNMETAIVNKPSYDYSTSLTVSERVFWKWLKESGAIRWHKDENNNIIEGDINTEGNSSKYVNVVKAIGKIDGVSQRSSDYGMYNEVYVNIPAAFGTSSPIFFKQVEDNNYGFSQKYITDDSNLIGYSEDDNINSGLYNFGFYDYSVASQNIKSHYSFNLSTNILWTDKYAKNITDDNVNMYLTDDKLQTNEYDVIEVKMSSANDANYPNYKFLRSTYDCMMLDILLSNEEYTINNMDYDSLATTNDSIDYQFNTILVYYSIYDNNDNVLATNLYGVYFIDSTQTFDASKNSSFNFKLNRLNKVKSNIDGFGTSYSFRLNMRTSSIYDNTELNIEDNSSSENSIVSDFNNVIANLNESIKLLGKNTKHTYILTEKYKGVQNDVLSLSNKINQINTNVNNLLQRSTENITTNSIETNALTLNDNKINIDNDDDIFNININDNNIFNYNNDVVTIEPTINISNITKTLNVNNTSENDVNVDSVLNGVNLLDYIKIVPKSSENNNTYDLLDLEIKNNVDTDDIYFALKNKKIDIMTVIAYILYKIK